MREGEREREGVYGQEGANDVREVSKEGKERVKGREGRNRIDVIHYQELSIQPKRMKERNECIKYFHRNKDLV